MTQNIVDYEKLIMIRWPETPTVHVENPLKLSQFLLTFLPIIVHFSFHSKH